MSGSGFLLAPMAVASGAELGASPSAGAAACSAAVEAPLRRGFAVTLTSLARLLLRAWLASSKLWLIETGLSSWITKTGSMNAVWFVTASRWPRNKLTIRRTKSVLLNAVCRLGLILVTDSD